MFETTHTLHTPVETKMKKIPKYQRKDGKEVPHKPRGGLSGPHDLFILRQTTVRTTFKKGVIQDCELFLK